jgi:hypothetical protein
MKWLLEIILDGSSLEEEEEENDKVEMAMVVILNKEIRPPRLGSQFSCLYINQDRAEGHTMLMRDNFKPDATYLEKYFRQQFQMHKSLFLT